MSMVDFINGSSWISEITRTLAMHLRLYYPWNKYSMYKLRKSSTVPPSMLKARTYFKNNESRINKISEYLADEQSIETFHKLIHMRQYYENADIPQYNYFDQYFPKDIIKFSNNEVFVDGGGFTGDTLLRFRKLCPNYKRIVTFEPDKRNISRMKRKVGGGKPS